MCQLTLQYQLKYESIRTSYKFLHPKHSQSRENLMLNLKIQARLVRALESKTLPLW